MRARARTCGTKAVLIQIFVIVQIYIAATILGPCESMYCNTQALWTCKHLGGCMALCVGVGGESVDMDMLPMPIYEPADTGRVSRCV